MRAEATGDSKANIAPPLLFIMFIITFIFGLNCSVKA